MGDEGARTCCCGVEVARGLVPKRGGVGVDTGSARKAATKVGLFATDAAGEAFAEGVFADGVLAAANCEPAARRYWANRVSAASNWLLLTKGRPGLTKRAGGRSSWKLLPLWP